MSHCAPKDLRAAWSLISEVCIEHREVRALRVMVIGRVVRNTQSSKSINATKGSAAHKVMLGPRNCFLYTTSQPCISDSHTLSISPTLITVDKDLAQRLREQANDLDTGRGDLEQYLNSHPANPSNLREPTLEASDEDSERYSGRLTPRALDHPLSSIIERLPFLRRITAFPQDGIGSWWTRSEAETSIKKNKIRRIVDISDSLWQASLTTGTSVGAGASSFLLGSFTASASSGSPKPETDLHLGFSQLWSLW
jgi:hypothetical protein